MIFCPHSQNRKLTYVIVSLFLHLLPVRVWEAGHESSSVMQRLKVEKVVGVGYRGGAQGLKKTEGRQDLQPPCRGGIPAPRAGGPGLPRFYFQGEAEHGLLSGSSEAWSPKLKDSWFPGGGPLQDLNPISTCYFSMCWPIQLYSQVKTTLTHSPPCSPAKGPTLSIAAP